ncbi:sodium- and chloride-dependent neutral and basic amino acid transporter B(0+)-like [Acanthaster planci]|uniref:Transporter n=1 Tax=Acanthaster planci TaxID=133434 RepID=A0A8B7ZHJ4_ACAPL|nr:sodium- and chloride-dependent neutral and basic amino acid transporter B(0+)-like [Acanthaster planci]
MYPGTVYQLKHCRMNGQQQPEKDDLGADEKDDGAVELEEEGSGDENKERGNWSHPLDFVLSCLGLAVGLGNLWRFPFLCYRNGGGAFLIPYFLSLAFAGMPMFFMEVNFGQYCSLGIMTCWRAFPILKGVSYGQFLVCFYVSITYGVVISYTFYYFFISFTSSLPWVGCGQPWNTPMCSDIVMDCFQVEGVITLDNECVPLKNLTEFELEELNITVSDPGNFSLENYNDPWKAMRKSPSEEYWMGIVTQKSPKMNETGTIVWQLLLCLMCDYVITFLCQIKGVKSLGKVVYFTATFPYVVLIILLIRGLTLPGSDKGVYFFITPRWEYLVKPKVWLDAVVQIFYSLSVATGGLQTLASYNKFHNNTYRDLMIVSILNSATSILAGFAIFSILGYMAHVQGKEVSEVVRQGFGLAFVAYPEAVARMPASPFWSILFFFMLITLGLDTQFVGIERLATSLVDEYPRLFPPRRKSFVTLGICVVLVLSSLICITEAGPYWMSLLDNYGANFAMVLFAFLITGGLSWGYGVRRFINDIRTMIGDRYVDTLHFKWWTLNWVVLTPLSMGVILVFNWVSWTEPEYNGSYPPWARALGWMIMITTLIGIPGHVVFELLRRKGSFMERFRNITSPLDSWGPALTQHREEAAEVHRHHGTTMGGVVCLAEVNATSRTVKYATLGKDEMEVTV